MEIPSPSPSHAGDKSEEDAPISTNSNYLSPLSFLSLDGGSWPQQPGSGINPSAIYGDMPFEGLGSTELSYDFTFGDGFLGLPSPPNTNASYDPPSPSNGLGSSASSIMDIPISLDPALTSTAYSSNSEDRPSPNDSTTGAGVKRNQKGDGTRTKTSHTTIERRYRDNLNSGMVGLRQAVPALRILDKNISPPPGVIDVIDDRGYVDGIRAAKKNSKSAILGKATEYIMVLKRRENRLRTELNALKIFVIENLPDGMNTLAQWETNHKAQFGGEQSDELPIQDTMEEEDDDEGEGPRPAKKLKLKPSDPIKKEVKKVTAPPPLGPNGEPLKRKRGRPRKVPVPSPDSSEMPLSLGESQFSVLPQAPTSTEAQPVRYLLTAFAFFSFLGNFPTPKSSFGNTHEGTVLNQLPVKLPINHDWWNSGFLQMAQLVTSLLLMLSLLAPYLPASIQSTKVTRMFSVSSSGSPRRAKSTSECNPVDNSSEPMTDKADICGLVTELKRYLGGKPNSKVTLAIWRRVAREAVLQGTGISWIRRLRIYLALSLDPQAAVERTLIGYPIFPSSSAKKWEALRRTDGEMRKLAFSKSIQESLQCLNGATEDGATPNMELDVILARCYLATAMNDHARLMFSEKVLGSSCREDNEGKDDIEGASFDQSFKGLAKVLGSDFALLLQASLDITSPSPAFPDITNTDFNRNLATVRNTLRATQLFTQLFPNRPPTAKTENTPLSPPPSPSTVRNRYNTNRQHELRCLLGQDGFEHPVVDQARDVVVDLLTRSL